MDSEAHGAELPGEPDRSRRTGLTRRTPEGIDKPERIKEPARSGAARGELMRLFVAIAPPAAVLDELDALTRPHRTGRLLDPLWLVDLLRRPAD